MLSLRVLERFMLLAMEPLRFLAFWEERDEEKPQQQEQEEEKEQDQETKTIFECFQYILRKKTPQNKINEKSNPTRQTS